LKASLKKAFTDGTNPNHPKGKGDETIDSDFNYVKGSHKAIFQIQFFLKLLEAEHTLFSQVLADTSINEKEFDEAFIKLVQAAFNFFIKRNESVVKEKGVNKVLILLDILDNLNSLLPRYRLILKNLDGVYSRMEELGQLVAGACEKAIQEYRDYVLAYTQVTNKSSAKQPKDGTIYTLTIETLNFLKRLYEYKNTVEGMKLSTLPESQGMEKGKISSLTNITLMILTALEQNLEAKAKTYKPAALSCIFLINNYHYIAKQIGAKSKLQVGRGLSDKYEQTVKKLREDYKAATWDKVMTFIDMNDSKEILAKCVPTVSKVAKKQIKAKFTGFNNGFQELYGSQRLYSVPDSDLRSQLRNDNVDLLHKAYKNFLNTYSTVEFSSHAGTYIKYDVQTIEVMLNKFFDEES